MKKKRIEKEIEWVDIHNDELMTQLGFRQPVYVCPDFTKTTKEKKILKKLRTKKDHFYSAGPSNTANYMPLFDKLIVYTTRKNGHSTYSFKCNVSEVQKIISNWFNDGTLIKYHWNGKTYYA